MANPKPRTYTPTPEHREKMVARMKERSARDRKFYDFVDQLQERLISGEGVSPDELRALQTFRALERTRSSNRAHRDEGLAELERLTTDAREDRRVSLRIQELEAQKKRLQRGLLPNGHVAPAEPDDDDTDEDEDEDDEEDEDDDAPHEDDPMRPRA
jgi:hypothetical protein